MNIWSATSPYVFWLVLLIFIILIVLYLTKLNKYRTVISKIDNNNYKVLNINQYQKATERLAYLVFSMRQFVHFLNSKKEQWSTIENLKTKYNKISMINRLNRRFPPKYVEEGKCGKNFIENKSDKLVICLREKDGSFKNFKKLNKVALHELAHMASKTTGHTNEFHENHKFLSYVYQKIFINQLR